MREADRIVSLKENMDALSWGRVLEIGRQLQSEVSDEVRAELARELTGIAQSNISLTARLGMDPRPPAEHLMASGVEVVEGGLAEAALLQQQGEPKGAPDEADCGAGCNEEAAATAGEGVAGADDDPFEPQEPVESRVFQSTTELPLAAASLCAAKEPAALAEDAAQDGDDDAFEPDEGPAAGCADEGAETGGAQQALSPEGELEAAAVSDPEPKAAPEEPLGSETECGREPEAAAAPEPEPASDPDPAPEPAPVPASRSEPQPDSASVTESPRERAKRPSRERFARFRRLYESRDGSICVFEDEHGHLVSVDASKLV